MPALNLRDDRIERLAGAEFEFLRHRFSLSSQG
jgi:hypothetical protein